MKRARSLLFLLALALSLSAGVSYASDGYVYATTNMTWAEFYAGETGETSSDLLSAGLDAISTPTTHGLGRFPLVMGESGDSGTTITGLKAVQVRMTQDVYNSLADNSRYTVANGSFDEYKEVNSDGSFGKMVTESTNATASGATVRLATGSSARWGHYVFSVNSADIEIGSANRYCDYYLGALLETSDGKIYGMRHDNNLWSNTDVAFTVTGNYVEPHGFGTQRYYKYTKDLAGKTVTKITYMLKDKPDVVLSGLNIYLKKLTDASVKAEKTYSPTSDDIEATLVFSRIPDGVTYTLSSVTKGSGRGAVTLTNGTDYTYDAENKVLTIVGGSEESNYVATFTTDEYADIAATIEVGNFHYATTNMTWAEFYAGEIGDSSANLAVSYDAVSTATVRFATRFNAFSSSTSDSGTTFTGLKSVQVRMSETVYNSLSNDTRYTFVTDGSQFSEYKAADASGGFGAAVTEKIDANSAIPSLDVTITGGKSNGHGNYRLTISGLSYDVLGITPGVSLDNFIGAKLETTDGTVYGLKPLHNLWIRGNLAEQIGFCVEDFTERNGTHLSYAHTADLPGKTIDGITYMFKNQPDIVINCELPVKLWSNGAITVSGDILPGKSSAVHFTSSDLPSDSSYVLSSVARVEGRTSTALTEGTGYTYSDDVLTLIDAKPGNYTATFSDENYVDIAASITVSDDYYAVTDMTWAEFYAGETGQTASELLAAGLDAVSSPTARVANRFTQLVSESNDIGGRKITGVKDVQVKMTADVYNVLSNDSRFTLSDTAFTQYKAVSADGSFGAMVTESEDISGASVAVLSGASSTWGSYMLNITSIDITLSSGDENYYLGALAETSGGKIYGLRHNNNLWFSADNIAFTVNGNYSEPHGVSRDYAYTADLEGETITKITYLLKNQPSAVLDCNAYLKPMSTATVSTSEGIITGNNVPIAFTFGSLPDGVTYTLKALYSGTGRGRTEITDYTYNNGTLTLNGTLPAGRYQAIFETDNYSDIGVVFTVEDIYHYAVTDMTWAEFYAGELGESSADLYTAGLDAISSPTARVANRFSQLTSESNDIGGRSITGVADVQVRMGNEVYTALSSDSRYTFSDETFSEYKPVNADGSFGAMVTETHVQEGATVTLTAPGTWGDYVLAVSSIDITVNSGDEYYYLGALVETSDGKVYGMRHNNNLWFNAKDLAISTAEFVEVHGVSRSYKYTSDMEGKTITKITYMLKNLPDEIVSCDLFLKYKTSASVSPKYETGWHGIMTEGSSVDVTLVFSDVPSSADYKISGVTFGTGRGRKALSGYSMSGDVLTFKADKEGIYTATFTDETYANISATINVFTVNATDKIISADNNKGGLNFLLTPAGMIDAVDADMADNRLVPASDYTDPDANFTAIFDGGIKGTGFSFDITLDGVSPDYKGIAGFGKMVYLTPENCGNMYPTIYSTLNAMPTGPSGYKEVASITALKLIGISAIAVQPDGTLRDVSAFTGAGVMILSESNIMVYYGTMMADCVSSDLREGEHMLSPEGENLIADGKKDGHIIGVMYLELTHTASEDVQPTPKSDDVTPAPKSDDVIPTPTPGSDTSSVTLSKPAITLTDSKKADITDKLGKLSSKVTGSTEVSELPSSAIKGTRTVTSSDTAVYLPVIEVSESKVYVFGVSLDKFAVNTPIYWQSNAVNASTGEFVSAADDEEAVIFMDDSGEEVTAVPANKHVNVAAYLETGRTYYPAITTSSSQSDEYVYGVGSSSGGCNAGISAIILGLGLILINRKQKM